MVLPPNFSYSITPLTVINIFPFPVKLIPGRILSDSDNTVIPVFIGPFHIQSDVHLSRCICVDVPNALCTQFKHKRHGWGHLSSSYMLMICMVYSSEQSSCKSMQAVRK